MELDGYAIGGLAVGESHEEMYHILEETVPYLPLEKPTYLMGVGTPANILEGVERGPPIPITGKLICLTRNTKPTTGLSRKAAAVRPAAVIPELISAIC